MSKKEANQNLTQDDEERLKKQAELAKNLRGKVQWVGDLDDMRTDPQGLQDWCDSQWNKEKSQDTAIVNFSDD